MDEEAKKKLERYELDRGSGYEPVTTMMPDLYGDWCLYDDVEALERRLAALRELLKDLLADICLCKEGTVPTGATLGKMERRIREELAKEEK